MLFIILSNDLLLVPLIRRLVKIQTSSLLAGGVQSFLEVPVRLLKFLGRHSSSEKGISAFITAIWWSLYGVYLNSSSETSDQVQISFL